MIMSANRRDLIAEPCMYITCENFSLRDGDEKGVQKFLC